LYANISKLHGYIGSLSSLLHRARARKMAMGWSCGCKRSNDSRKEQDSLKGLLGVLSNLQVADGFTRILNCIPTLAYNFHAKVHSAATHPYILQQGSIDAHSRALYRWNCKFLQQMAMYVSGLFFFIVVYMPFALNLLMLYSPPRSLVLHSTGP
jgi:hypothetical protein